MADDRHDLTSGDPLGAPSPGPTAGPAAGYGPGSAPPGAFAERPRPERPVISEATLASWGSRAIATIIDNVIVGGAALVILALLGAGFFADGDLGVGELIVGGVLTTLLFCAIALVYAPLLMARTNGQTLGRMAVGIRVVRTGGEPTDFWWSALREVAVKGLLVGIASSATGGIAYFVDVLWPIPDAQNRALHDYVVDSRVVKA